MDKKIYEYIAIVSNNDTWQGKPIFEILNKNSSEPLGRIFYYPSWGRFVVQYNPDAIFDASCIKDIVDFLDNEIAKIEKE